MKVKDFMARDVATCGPWDDLAAAAQSMEMNGSDCLPVVDGAGRAVGMLTDHDISIAAGTKRAPLSSLRVAAAMRKGVHACDPEDRVHTAQKIMEHRQVPSVPVVSADGRLVGLVFVSKLARKVGRRRRATPRV